MICVQPTNKEATKRDRDQDPKHRPLSYEARHDVKNQLQNQDKKICVLVHSQGFRLLGTRSAGFKGSDRVGEACAGILKASAPIVQAHRRSF